MFASKEEIAGKRWKLPSQVKLLLALCVALGIGGGGAAVSTVSADAVVRPEHYGAVADDGLDDTRAIRQAMLEGAGAGLPVSLSPGTYRIAPPQAQWGFSNGGTDGDWTVTNAAYSSVGGGSLSATAAAAGPLSITSPAYLGLDAGKYKQVKLLLKNASDAEEATIFWTGAPGQPWTTLRSATIALTPYDTQATEYVFDLSGHAQWSGAVHQVSVRFGDDPASGVLELDHIRFDAGTVRNELMYSFSFLFHELQGLELAGDETVLLITDPVAGFFRCLDCSELSFEGITIEYETPPFIQGTVASIDQAASTFDFVPDPGYTLLEDPRFGELPRIWGTVRDADNPLLMKSSANDHINVNGWTKLSDGMTYRFQAAVPSQVGPGQIEAGDPFVMVTRDHGNGIFRLEESDTIAVTDVTVHGSSGATLVGYYTDGIEIDRLRIMRKPGSNQMIVTNADSVHVQSARTGPVVQDSLFEGVMDDIVAIYNRPLLISQIISETELHVQGISGSKVPRAGDRLQFFRAVNGVVLGTATVVSVQPDSLAPATKALITLDTPVAGLHAGSTPSDSDLVYNLSTVGAGFSITDSIFRDSRRNGLYLKSTDGWIEGNLFQNLGNAGVMLTDDPDVPNGPAPMNIHVLNNVTDHVNFLDVYSRHPYAAAITVFSQKSGRAVADGRNITDIVLEGNLVRNPVRNGIYLGGVRGAVLTDNEIEVTGTEAVNGVFAGLSIEHSDNIEVDGLTIADTRPQLTAGILIQGIVDNIAADRLSFALGAGVPDILDWSTAPLPEDALVVPVLGAGYGETGSSWINSGLKGHDGNLTRYSFAGNATASWTPELEAGTYEVFVYRVTSSNSEPASRLEVYHNAGVSQRVLDYTAGSAGWVSLGTYSFQAGTGGYVKLSHLDPLAPGGALRAAAVAFVRQE
ncbi:right-handed parallel beta-helix repeat-containing protein [Paenibacillus sp. YN15]|uniref:golvesin C-terminal-like domain-containing protein n=1 Tax=Paenibacillus sp. YN15 TaxID=1742774 RepID=UPI000DCCC1B1|nr:right-handed parallel beta-helix repeat-containing protein [Paenibacillus sp. YN15]RAU98624.1 hypothetical protein DQG13_17165 [Paenibacillus sp. YN15]